MAFLASLPSVRGALNNNTQVASPPDDNISSLACSPVEDYLAIGSWDNRVRIFDTTKSTTGILAAAIDFDGPVLCCHWSGFSTLLLSTPNL